MLLYLRSWWSRTYGRPLKDPLLEEYSLEDLLYEFYDRIERRLAEEERLKDVDDKIEEKKEKEVLDWVEQQEKEELERSKKVKDAAQATEKQPVKDPREDEANVKWMEEQLRLNREVHGQTFVDEIDESFS